MIYLLSFREPGRNRGGAVTGGEIETRHPLFHRGDGLPEIALGDRQAFETETRLLFLIHGYNTSGSKGEFNLLSLADRLGLGGGWGVVCVLWPGDHWTRAASYPFEGDDADATGVSLAKFIDDFAARTAEVHFVAHSLGARVGMKAIDAMRGRRRPEARIGQICLAAPAIDDYSLGYPRAYRRAVSRADRVAVMASKKDTTLRWAFPVGELLQNFVFWRDTYGLALGYHGPKNAPKREAFTPDKVHPEQIPKRFEVNHGDYIGYVEQDDQERREKLDRARAFITSCLLDTFRPPVYR